MNTRALRSLISKTFAGALALAPGWVSAQQLYRLTDIGTLGGSPIHATAINRSGQITGDASTGGPQHAFLWDGTTIRDLGTLGGLESFGLAINASGEVTGYSWMPEFPAQHAFLWNGSAMKDLGTLGGIFSKGLDINDSGQVAGFATTAAGNNRAFLWNGASLRGLGTLGGKTSSGEAINASGQVAGCSQTSSGDSRAFLWNGSTMRDLGTLGGKSSCAGAINAAGQVAGASTKASGWAHAFLWNGTRMRDLGTLGTGKNSFIAAINASGQVTGTSMTHYFNSESMPDSFHGFFWDGTSLWDMDASEDECFNEDGQGLGINASGQVTGWILNRLCEPVAYLWSGGALHFIDDLIDPADPLQPFVSLSKAVDINVRGQIAAEGSDVRTSGLRVYLVTPLEYQVDIVAPAASSSWKRGATVAVKAALVDTKGKRISDARANSLIATPCKVKFSASGGQTKTATCMNYNATTNEFFFDWRLGTTGTGSTALKVAATYTFSMPQRITTAESEPISIVQ